MPKKWAEEDVQFLEENVGKLKVSTIAKKINKSITAVELKMKRLGISGTKLASGKLTANELATALNVDNHTVYRWINNHGLKAVKKATKESARFNLISVEDFWKWAKDNKEKIIFYRIEPNVLIPEPSWLEEERRKDYEIIPKRQSAKWTEYEDKRLIELLKGRYTHKEIGAALNRSANSVQRRLSRLKEQNKVPISKVMLKWTEKELNMLHELELQGLTDDEIAYELGREAYHIRDKRRCLRRKGEYQGRKRVV